MRRCDRDYQARGTIVVGNPIPPIKRWLELAW